MILKGKNVGSFFIKGECSMVNVPHNKIPVNKNVSGFSYTENPHCKQED
jgi:hypothetical protein